MNKRLNRARVWYLLPGIILATVVIALIGLWSTPLEVGAIPAQQAVPVVGFANSVYTADEDRSPAVIEVSVNATPEVGRDVVVSYLTLPGTAQEGQGGDFLRASGTLTFTNTSGNVLSFDITILNDSIVNEPDKTVILLLRLDSPATATLGRGEATLIIRDDDFATATPQTGQATTTPIFVDPLEPNNTFGEAKTVAVDAAPTCRLTLWPPGDLDYFKFAVKEGTFYQVTTDQVSPGLDTVLTIYNQRGDQIARNDDAGGIGVLSSEVNIRASETGTYFALVTNKSPLDPANLTYCFQIEATAQPTPTPTATLLPLREGADACEPNGSVELACLFGVNQSQQFNFVPPFNQGPDHDYYRMWVVAGTSYTCETSELSNVTDTNLIFLDGNGGDFNPQLGNNDRAPGDLSSQLSFFATYTGYLTILVNPVNQVPVSEAERFTYTLSCVGTVAPTAVPTSPPAPPTGGGTGTGFVPTVQPTFTPFPTPTPFDIGALLTPAPIVLPIVTVQPLPTATPVAGQQDVSTVGVVVYYDSNFNFLPELNEGIVDVAVALYDNSNGRLLAFGYTNEDGSVRFENIPSTGAVRVEVPLLNYTQIVGSGETNINVRVAPVPLPIGIP